MNECTQLSPSKGRNPCQVIFLCAWLSLFWLDRHQPNVRIYQPPSTHPVYPDMGKGRCTVFNLQVFERSCRCLGVSCRSWHPSCFVVNLAQSTASHNVDCIFMENQSLTMQKKICELYSEQPHVLDCGFVGINIATRLQELHIFPILSICQQNLDSFIHPRPYFYHGSISVHACQGRLNLLQVGLNCIRDFDG